MSYFDDLSRIRIVPMYRVQITVDNGDGSNTLHGWEGLEKESSWGRAPLLSTPDREGQPRIIGWRIQCTAYIPYNDFETMRATLADLQSKRVVDFTLLLRSHPAQDGGAQALIQVTEDAAAVRSFGVTFEEEKMEWRPRLIIRLQCIASRDLMDADDGDAWYKQVDGWD